MTSLLEKVDAVPVTRNLKLLLFRAVICSGILRDLGIYDLPMSGDGMSSGHHNQVPKKVVWSSMLSRPSKAIPSQETWRLRPAMDRQDACQP